MLGIQKQKQKATMSQLISLEVYDAVISFMANDALPLLQSHKTHDWRKSSFKYTKRWGQQIA